MIGPRRLLPLALALLWAAAAVGEPHAGLEYQRAPVAGGAAHLITVDLAQTRLQMLDARDFGETALTARQFQERSGATAVVNGPFFDLDGTPMGLLVVDGAERRGLRPVDWGVFSLDAAGASIVHTRDWKPRDGVRQAFQVGPRLLVGGEPVALKKQSARRTALCVQDPSHLRVVVVDHSLEANALTAALKGLGCQDALNLDGGGSSQLYLARAGATIDVPGDEPIPVALGFFADGSAAINSGAGCNCR